MAVVGSESRNRYCRPYCDELLLLFNADQNGVKLRLDTSVLACIGSLLRLGRAHPQSQMPGTFLRGVHTMRGGAGQFRLGVLLACRKLWRRLLGKPRGQATRRVLLVIGVAVPGLIVGLSAGSSADTVQTTTYTATETIPVPPSSNYEGSAGGDGWAVALSPTQVFNVFHHDGILQFACHLQSDASACYDPETIEDANGTDFDTSGQPGLYLDQSTGKLYVYATRSSDLTGGVVCIDTTKAATDPDPFCGFTALTAVGDASPPTSGLSDPALVGSRWYAFNYVDGSGATGTRNRVLCFDVATFSPCAGQPYAVTIGVGDVSKGGVPFSGHGGDRW